ncbi:MAG: hypothetical protein LQ343_005286 [Gyalolechia ehrenbergii]|nr:MAG: hypothetical protein LQ343_005286 [Gyalolechia ehrenbergii]
MPLRLPPSYIDSSKGSPHVSVQTTHLALAHIKGVLYHCTQIHHCAYCSTQADHMMLAVVVITKVVCDLEEVVGVYINRRTSFTRCGTQRQHPEDCLRHDPHQSPREQQQDNDDCYNLHIGDYLVNSEDEWAAVIKPLCIILSKRTLDLLKRMQEVARAGRREVQVQMLSSAEQKPKRASWSI